MSRTGCIICTHKKVVEINKRLIDKLCSGESFQIIADYFGVSATTLQSHYKGNPDKNEPSHIATLLSKSKDAASLVSADAIFCDYKKSEARLDQLDEHLDSVLSVPDGSQLSAYIGAIREARAVVGERREQRRFVAELQKKIAVDAQVQINLQQNNVNIYSHPAWAALGTILARILEPYPDLKTQIASELIAYQDANP